MDVSVAGVEIQRSLPDAMGLEGSTGHATQSRVLRGRDPSSIRQEENTSQELFLVNLFSSFVNNQTPIRNQRV